MENKERNYERYLKQGSNYEPSNTARKQIRVIKGFGNG